MESLRGLVLNLIVFICVFSVATTYTCLGLENVSVVYTEQERLALLKFKHSVNDPFGMLSTWVGNDCCMWEGIQCDIVTGTVESLHLRGDSSSHDVLRPENEYLVSDDSYLVHDFYYLIGNEVNSSLAELRHLKYLDLSGNDFLGSRIPEFIGSLKQLSYLNLSYSGFYGIIPPHIGNLSNLKILDLSSNGGLMADDMAWTFGLLSLEHLDLSSLYLSEAQNWYMVLYMIPSLEKLSLSSSGLFNIVHGPFLNSSKMLPNVKHLDLGFNSFQGQLPDFFQNMTSLTFLDLSWFDFSLTWNFAKFLNMIPSLSKVHLSYCGLHKMHLSPAYPNSSTLSNIQHLDLSFNSIKGTFPSVLTNMSSLKVLDLSANMLSSSVPIMPNLLELDISSNEFKEIEHVGIRRQCHLKQLRASNNYFHMEKIDSPKNFSECSRYALERLYLDWSLNGTMPEPLGKLTNLRGLHLSGNKLRGLVPESLRRLRFLEVLDLSHNLLAGPIPNFLGKLSKLDLSFNQLDGSVPKSFGNSAALTYLNLGSNRLNGHIPVSIGQLSKLHFLDISNNFLEGEFLEAHFANLSMLKLLDTSSNNKLTFNISCEWIPPFKLVTLRLSSCNIINGFPSWLRNQRKLEMLVLSNASISGPLPTWLRDFPIIPFLDLSHNKLIGSLKNLPNGGNFKVYGYGFLKALFLGNNLFNESIPRSLCKWTDLEYLDLSKNRLTGKVPKCFKNLQNMVTMRLSSNHLSGFIPSSLALISLYWLQLNDNNFTGEIPQELENLRYLKVLDLGDNNLSGSIPNWIGEKLPSLMVLRLHKNNYTGRIPRSLCKSTNLQILDVAYNSLSGIIPNCVGELNAMINGSQVNDWNNATLDSDEYVIQVIKGADLKYTTTLRIVFNIDLSSNKLSGDIPIELTALSKLVGLNLSNNHFRGGIPVSIGNMTSLISLDLSRNELVGMIPPSMAALTFLSQLNVSHNNLSGRIPTGNQMQTFTDPSIYVGNKDLCGAPLPKNCSNQENSTITRSTKKSEETDDSTKTWLFYGDIMCGFATGFWGVIGVLLFKKQWRQKLFMFAEQTMDKIYVAVLIRVAKMKRRRLGLSLG